MTTQLRRNVRLGAFLIVAALVATLASPSTASAASSEDRGSAAILTATNGFRIDNGRTALLRDGGIDSVAQTWAERMLARRELAHNPNFGSQMPQSGLSGWGENVGYACGYGGVDANASTIMKNWKASTGHRANMLNEAFTHIGIGFAYSASSDCAYAVQNFGRYSGTFVDVPATHQFATEIEWLVDRSITTGYADGRFKPKNSVTREAFAAFLYRLAGRPSFSTPSRSPFTDVSTSDQFYKEISWLSRQGITSGYADGTFRPDAHISREAIAAFLYRASGSPYVAPIKDTPFKDVAPNDQFASEIVWLSNSRITTGYADGTFRPYGAVTREATAAFLYRARSIVDF